MGKPINKTAASSRITLNQWLHSEDGKNKAWVWQSILDALAVGENLPLQIVRLNYLHSLYQNAKKVVNQAVSPDADPEKRQMQVQLKEDFNKHFPNLDAWNKCISDTICWAEKLHAPRENQELQNQIANNTLDIMTRLYSSLAPKLFPTLPANPFPTDMLARMMLNKWQAFYLLWLYNWLIQKAQLPKSNDDEAYCKNALTCPTLHMVVHSLSDPKSKESWLLLAGPSFSGPVSLFAESQYDQDVIAPVVTFLDRFTAAVQGDGVVLKPRLYRAAHAATPLPEMEIKYRLERILQAIPSILECDVTALANSRITNHDVRQLSLWALFIVREGKEIGTILSKKGKIRLTHDSDSLEVVTAGAFLAPPRVCFSAARDNSHSLAIMVKEIHPSSINHKNVCQYGFDLQIHGVNLSEEHFIPFRMKLNQLYLRAHHKSRLLDSKRLLLISDWLHGEVNEADDVKKANYSTTANIVSDAIPEREFSRKISLWLNGLMRADGTILYRYDVFDDEHGMLSALYGYFRDPAYSNSDKYCSSLREDMRALAKEKKRADMSIAYRAIESSSTRHCFAYNSKINMAHPPGENLFHSEATKKQKLPLFRTVVAAPVRFNGRIQGLIEVSGREWWQFRWGHKPLLEQAASVISPLLYQQRYLRSLRLIQKEMLAFSHGGMKEKELYDQVCKSIAALFLCDGATIWVRNNQETHLLEQKGKHNITRNDHQTIDLNSNTPGANALLNFDQGKKNAAFEVITVEDLPENGELNRQLIKKMVLLPLYNPTKKNAEKCVTAAVSLYTRDDIGFSSAWNSIMNFMNDYLALIVESVDAFIQEQKVATAVVEHEIWHDAVILAEKAKKLIKPRKNLQEGLNRLSELVDNQRFRESLDSAALTALIDKHDADIIKNLAKDLDDSWFKPQHDIEQYANSLATRTNSLFDKHAKAENGEKQELHQKTGDEYIAVLAGIGEKIEPINLHDLVDSILRSDSNMGHISNYCTSKWQPLAKRSVLKTVLQNLLDNACKYSSIMVPSIETTPSRWGGVVVKIENRGPPMNDKNEQHRVLLRGVRGSNSQKNKVMKHPGKGLGLYIVKQLCQHVLKFDFEFEEIRVKDAKNSTYVATLNVSADIVKRV